MRRPSMTDITSHYPSLADRVRSLAADAPVVNVHFLKKTPVFVLGEETLLFADSDNQKSVKAHGGGILVSACDGERVFTGGDDGRLVATNAAGEATEIAKDDKKRWIDQLALGPDGAVAWSVGKTAFVRTGKGEVRSHEAPSTVGGLCFAPKGFRLAIAHYNGVSFWFPKTAAAPEFFEWKGSHLGVTVSPDGRFVVTTMQEPMLHGWRVVDSKHMRMSGYSGRVRSMDWASDGTSLATSGSEQVILWLFDGKDGPMGRQPRLLAPEEARVAVVACHPKQPVVAAGYAHGLVLLVRMDDGALIQVRAADGDPVTALGWDASGQTLGYGTESGDAGVLTL